MAHALVDIYEQSITRKYRAKIWSKFVAGIKEYKMLKPDDSVLIALSGERDSFMMARLFIQLMKHTDFHFTYSFVLVNDNLTKEQLDLINKDISLLLNECEIIPLINYDLKETLYEYAVNKKCNLIALGSHYDDVIETTLMNLLSFGKFETILPKQKYKSISFIRPMYLVREKDIISWTNYHELEFITRNEDSEYLTMKKKTKELIKDLFKNYNIQVEKNIFTAGGNVTLDMILGYIKDNKKYNYLDIYK